jgi:hypothetical protein
VVDEEDLAGEIEADDFAPDGVDRRGGGWGGLGAGAGGGDEEKEGEGETRREDAREFHGSSEGVVTKRARELTGVKPAPQWAEAQSRRAEAQSRRAEAQSRRGEGGAAAEVKGAVGGRSRLSRGRLRERRENDYDYEERERFFTRRCGR